MNTSVRAPSPRQGDGVRSGDVWRCDECRRQHQVTVHSDPRDRWFTWEVMNHA